MRHLEKGASPKEPIYDALLEELDASAREAISNVSGAPAAASDGDAGEDSGEDEAAPEPATHAKPA